MKKTLIVNLMGSPGSGKSTMMADIFSKLKWQNIDCEMVTEFAKDLVWESRDETFKDEIYIFAKQSHRLFRINSKVDVVITDRPLILTLYYNNKYGFNSKELDALCISEFNKYNNLNFFLNRKKKYNPNGRNQTEEESNEIAIELEEIMTNIGIKYYAMNGDKEAVKIIVDMIIAELKKGEQY